jgi:hypothetical protein
MIVHSYIMSFPDDRDVILDALQSLETFSDQIFVVDGGFTGALSHHPRYTQPLKEFFSEHFAVLKNTADYTVFNPTCPIFVYEHPFYDPGSQRNWLTKTMEARPDQPDWYIWIDADEVCSAQMENGIRNFLVSLKPEQTNVVMKWLNLCQDEQHMAGGNHSSWLAHGRAYRPGTVYYQAGWHEHQYYSGERVQFDVRVIHTRALYRKRLLVQRGHPRVSGKDNPLWGDVQYLEPVPKGVSWTPLTWPDDEIILPFEKDAREVWDAEGHLL